VKQRVSPLKLIRETVRELSGTELGQVAGGIGPSQTPTCYCSSIPCGGGPSQALLNPCIDSSIICRA
jgi:hypothetical protein